MTENFTIAKGSFGYNLNFALKDSDGTARNLGGYSVKLQVWSPLVPGTLLLDAACTWTLATAGTCYYLIPAATTFATVGVFQYAVIPYVGTSVLDPALSGFITVTQYGGNYCTLGEIKSELGITGQEKDDSLQRMIEQVKGLIDSYCERSFSTVAETRYFDGAGDVLFIDDLVAIGGGSLTNGTGIATGSPKTLVHGANTITVTRVGNFTVILPDGVTGTAASGTCAVTSTPVSLVGGSQTITTSEATGTITITVNDGIWIDDGDRTYSFAMAATDYDFYPLNKTPKTRLELSPASDYGDFAEDIRKGIKITATWGYQATVPADIRRAALMWVTILETGRKAGYSNVVGSSETGQITIDRDPPAQVKKILDNGFRKKRLL